MADKINGRLTNVINVSDIQRQIDENKAAIAENSTLIEENSILINGLTENKQDVLVNQQNIKSLDNNSLLGKGNIELKTINNESLIGSGNFDIPNTDTFVKGPNESTAGYIPVFNGPDGKEVKQGTISIFPVENTSDYLVTPNNRIGLNAGGGFNASLVNELNGSTQNIYATGLATNIHNLGTQNDPWDNLYLTNGIYGPYGLIPINDILTKTSDQIITSDKTIAYGNKLIFPNSEGDAYISSNPADVYAIGSYLKLTADVVKVSNSLSALDISTDKLITTTITKYNDSSFGLEVPDTGSWAENKTIATVDQIPTNYVTTDTNQEISAYKLFTAGLKVQNKLIITNPNHIYELSLRIDNDHIGTISNSSGNAPLNILMGSGGKFIRYDSDQYGYKLPNKPLSAVETLATVNNIIQTVVVAAAQIVSAGNDSYTGTPYIRFTPTTEQKAILADETVPNIKLDLTALGASAPAPYIWLKRNTKVEIQNHIAYQFSCGGEQFWYDNYATDIAIKDIGNGALVFVPDFNVCDITLAHISVPSLLYDLGRIGLNLASAYNSNRSYNIGEKVSYNNVIYVCNTNNTTGDWNAAKWDEIKVAENIVDLSSNQNIAGTKTLTSGQLKIKAVDGAHSTGTITYHDSGDGSEYFTFDKAFINNSIHANYLTINDALDLHGPIKNGDMDHGLVLPDGMASWTANKTIATTDAFSATTTYNQEKVTLNGTNLTVVTRDTTQEIIGPKYLAGQIALSTLNASLNNTSLVATPSHITINAVKGFTFGLQSGYWHLPVNVLQKDFTPGDVSTRGQLVELKECAGIKITSSIGGSGHAPYTGDPVIILGDTVITETQLKKLIALLDTIEADDDSEDEGE